MDVCEEWLGVSSDELVSQPLLYSGRVIDEVPAGDVSAIRSVSSGLGECIVYFSRICQAVGF